MSDVVTNAPIAAAVKLTNALHTFRERSSQRLIHITVILPDFQWTVTVSHCEHRCVIRSRSVTQSARFSFCLGFGSQRKKKHPAFLFPFLRVAADHVVISAFMPGIAKFKA